MICASTECDGDEVKVIDSRPHESKNWIRRRRKCLKCGLRWNTIELGEFELDENWTQGNGQD
jgi:transcriptional regulator NrdR family protein